jgi:uncharacterized protein
MTPQQTIGECGPYLAVTDDGFIVKAASRRTIQDRWWPAIHDIVAAYVTHYCTDLHSLYVDGSVADGRAVDTRTDLDMLAVIDSARMKTWLAARWMVDLERTLVRRYPFMSGLDVAETALDDVWTSRTARKALQMRTVSVYGPDLSLQRGRLHLSQAFTACFTIQQRLVESLYRLEHDEHVDVASCCKWIAKHILRTGFELVMERERRFTAVPHACYESFSRHYPAKEPQMRRTLDLAVMPTNDRKVLAQVLVGWLIWLPNEVTALRHRGWLARQADESPRRHRL